MVVTVLFIDNYPNLKAIRSYDKSIRNVFMYIMLGFIIKHLFWLLFSELNKNKEGIKETT
ncbi:MAG: hypothetical protein ACK50L_08015 [Bacteroidota bacterium]|jgi:hypothetical protein